MSARRRVAELAARLPPLGGARPHTVLCYHRVDDTPGRFTVTVPALGRHLEVVRAAGRPIVPLAGIGGQWGPAVAVTFDDNEPSHLAAAVPVLLAHGAPATFFLNPGELGEPGKLSTADVARLLDAGMAVGAHGRRHVRYVDLEPEEVAADVEVCRTFLQDLGMPLLWAYPGGDPGSFTAEQDEALRRAGFTQRFTTVEGPMRAGGHRPQPRYVIRADSSDRYVAAAARGGLQLVAMAKRVRRTVRIPRLGRRP